MPLRKIAASLAIVSTTAFAQAALDDDAIGKLVKSGIGDQTIVTMIDQRPGKYALSSDDMIALKKAGVSDRILAAMIVRNGTAGGPSLSALSAAPMALALHDATPIRLRLTRDLTFSNVKPGEKVDFEIVDDLRIDGLLVMAHGLRATATITEVEPKTRMGRGGKLGVNLDSVPLLNGRQIAIRPAKKVQEGAHADITDNATGNATVAVAMVKPATTPLLFAYVKDEVFPEGTGITVYLDGEVNLDPTGFLVDIAFSSNPPGALVTMYGTPVGRTPFTTRLAPGMYKAVFSAVGYYDLTQDISVGPGYSNTVHAAFELK